MRSEASCEARDDSTKEHILWAKFAEATTTEDFCQSWLSIQCQILEGVRRAMLLLGEPDHGPFKPVAIWPNLRHNVTHLSQAAERALKERRGLLIKNDSTFGIEDTTLEPYHIAYPLEVSGKVHGVIVLGVDLRSRDEVQSIMRKLHWGAGWLEVMLLQSDMSKSTGTIERLQKLLDMVTAVVEHQQFHQAAMSFVNMMATSLACDRVSLGFMNGNYIKICAISHSAEFGKDMNLVRAIESAMDEAVDQVSVIVYPVQDDTLPLVTRVHKELSMKHGSGSICTIPMSEEERFFGGITLERPADRPFDQATIDLCETIAALAGPILDVKMAEDRWLITKAADTCSNQLKKLIGPGHVIMKMVSAALLLLLIFFSFAKGTYRVTAPTTLEGTVQRVVCAPFNGYIKEAPIRAGDIVQEGDVLCLLDERDLKLEHHKWLAQKEQFFKENREAMANRDRAKIQITTAKIDQATSQIALLNEQLVRTKIVAPFHGVVMDGDLSQSLGAPVERGNVLFEIAPLDDYRLILEVDEREIDEIKVDQHGELVLPSVPGDVFPFTVKKITPVTTAKEGRNSFSVEALLDNTSERLRPGMEGVGKISVCRCKLIWIWTHDMIDWVRLKAWSWWP